MTLRNFEAQILAEAKRVLKNSRLRQKDIMEWSTSEIKSPDGEKVYRLPETGVYISVRCLDKFHENVWPLKGSKCPTCGLEVKEG